MVSTEDNQCITAVLTGIDDDNWTAFRRLLEVGEQRRQKKPREVRKRADALDDIIPLHGQLPDFQGMVFTRRI